MLVPVRGHCCQAVILSPARKFPMERQAPDLIKDVKAKYGLVQKDLEKILGLSQQAVSMYEMGKVRRERYDIIQKLKDMMDGKLDKIAKKIIDDKKRY